MTAITVERRLAAGYRPRAGGEARAFRNVSLLFVAAASIGLYFAGDDLQAVLAPALVVAAAALLYFSVQIRREGHLPIFEAATMFVLATTVYSIVPLLQFALGGLQCGPWGDNRLYQWAPTPGEFGGFAWRHAVLLIVFVVVYLPVRGRRLWPLRKPVRPMRTTASVILASVIAISLWFAVLRLYAGPGVSSYHGGIGIVLRPLPLFVLQLANIAQIVCLTLKQCLIVLLLLGWNRRLYRIALVTWMAFEVGITLVTFESRASTMLLLLTAAVAYHAMVRPLRVKGAFTAGAVVLIGFLVFGVFRDVDRETLQQDPHAVWGAATEFQILFGTAYDLHMRRASGMIPPIPRQLYFSDFYRLIPSQLLPFYKWDPADWYVDLIGMGGLGQGFMFGVVAQSVIGFGYAELIVRAAVLALFYAFAHRAYRRYSHSFWATIGYLFTVTWAYYSFRSTSFDILYRLVYYFVPTWLLVKILTVLITRAKKPRSRGAMAA